MPDTLTSSHIAGPVGVPGDSDGEHSDLSATHVWLVLWKASRALEAYAGQSIDRVGMCLSDFAVLEALLHKGPLPVNVIGRKILLTSGSITTAIDRLSARGLVIRQDDPADGRTRLVHLTKPGRKLIEKAFAQHAAHLEEMFADLEPQQRAMLLTLLKRVGKATSEKPPRA